MFCKFCGNEIDEEVVVCPKCGKQVKELKRESASKSLNELVEDKDAWYYETWFIVLMFLFFFPAGIILLILKLNKSK